MKHIILISLIFICCFLFLALNNYKSEKDNHTSMIDDCSFYLPLKIGNTWTYKSYSYELKMYLKVVRTIIDTVHHKDGSLLFAFNESYNGSPSNVIVGYYGYENGTIYSCTNTDTIVDSIHAGKSPLLKSPIQVNNSWVFKWPKRVCSFIIASIDSNKSGRVPPDSVVLVVGRWDDVIDSSWFARDIGLIKRRSYFSNKYYSKTDLQSYEIQK